VRKRARRRVAPAVVATPTPEWFEYPFVERVVEELEPVETVVSRSPEFEEYSFESQPVAEPHAVAYVFGDAPRRDLPRR
jgi:hypothetical protein